MPSIEPIPTPSHIPSPDQRARVAAIVAAAEDRKAGDVKVLCLADVSAFTDYFVLASGTNERQVQAIADGIETRLREEAGEKPLHTEGYRTGQWVLLDFTDVVVHVFLEERRQFYGLERLWSDAPDVTADIGS